MTEHNGYMPASIEAKSHDDDVSSDVFMHAVTKCISVVAVRLTVRNTVYSMPPKVFVLFYWYGESEARLGLEGIRGAHRSDLVTDFCSDENTALLQPFPMLRKSGLYRSRSRSFGNAPLFWNLRHLDALDALDA